MRTIVSVIGNGVCEEDSEKAKIAFEVGKALVDNGYRVMTGGLNGVMKYALKGAKASEKYKEGDTIAVLPMYDETMANEYADIVIGTGIDLARDVITANAPVVVAIGGGSGTLGEIANAWTLYRMVIAIDGVEGWSSKLIGTKVGETRIYEEGFEDMVWGAKNAQEVIDLIKDKLKHYKLRFERITYDGRRVKEVRKS